MNNNTTPFDHAGDFPTLESAKAYLEGGVATNPEYHADRVRALRYVVRQVRLEDITTALDFGCGDEMDFQ
jgi:hypothetical protein